MGVLESLIQKRQVDAYIKKSNTEAVAGIFEGFNKARQTSLLADMENKKINAEMAKSGFRPDPMTGRFEPDEGLIDKLGLANPKEWKPKTKEEALDVERVKAGMTGQKEMYGYATDLRKEFNQDKVYKDYQTINRSEGAMKQAYEMSTNKDTKSLIASDQALGVLFQKMLDPESVVRESEYARTPEGAALMNRISSTLPKLQKGGLALTNDDRKALYDIAQKLLAESKKTMNTHIDRYSTLAQDYKVDPKLVLGNIKKFDIENGNDFNTTPGGNKYKVIQ